MDENQRSTEFFSGETSMVPFQSMNLKIDTLTLIYNRHEHHKGSIERKGYYKRK